MIWTLIGVVCALVLVVIGVLQSMRWKVGRFVAGRPRLSEAEFTERFFPEDQRETAIRIRQLLKGYLPVNVDRIQPSDRLGADLGLGAGYMRDLDLISVAMELEHEFKIEFDDEVDLREMTFKELVELVLEQTRKK
jgi:acyl carrier protein